MSMFARTPRGKKSQEAQNSRATIKIDRNFVQSFHKAVLDQGLQTVMLNTNSEISLTVGATGGSSIALNDKQGNVVADQADIGKILSVDSFISGERKASQKETTSKQLEATLATVVEMSREPKMGPPISKLSAGYLDVYRGVAAQMSVLAQNVKAFEALEVTGDANSMVKNYLLVQAARIRAAAGKFIRYRAYCDDEVPEKLNKFLKDEKVLNWVFVRLTQQRLSVNMAGFQIKNLLFPKDPSKGLAVSYYELMTDEIRENQGGLLRGMTLTYAVLSDQGFVKKFCNIADDADIQDFDTDIAKSLMNVPIMVVQPFINLDEVTEVLAKQGSKGFPWSVGSTLTHQDNLKFLGTVFKRLHYFAVTRANNKTALFEQIFTGFRYNLQADNKDVYAQFKAFAKDNEDIVSNHLMVTSTKHNPAPVDRGKLYAGLLEIMQISSADDHAVRTLAASLRIAVDANTGEFTTLDDFPEIPNGQVSVINDVWTDIINRRNLKIEDRARNQALLKQVMDKLPGSNAKKSTADRKNRVGAVRSGLSPAAISTLQVLRNRNFKSLADVLETWFRSFLNLNVQAAISNLIVAKIDWLLTQPLPTSQNELSQFIDTHEFNDFTLAKGGGSGDDSSEDADGNDDAANDLDGS